jgi:transcriptional regulator with XRE-family HTH domain
MVTFTLRCLQVKDNSVSICRMTRISFDDYWMSQTADQKRALAERLHTSVSYLSNLAHGQRRPSHRFVDLAINVCGVQLDFATCCDE